MTRGDQNQLCANVKTNPILKGQLLQGKLRLPSQGRQQSNSSNADEKAEIVRKLQILNGGGRTNKHKHQKVYGAPHY